MQHLLMHVESFIPQKQVRATLEAKNIEKKMQQIELEKLMIQKILRVTEETKFTVAHKLLSIESAKLEVEHKLKMAEEANVISENKRQEVEHEKEIVKQKLQENVEAKMTVEKKKNEVKIEKLMIEKILRATEDAKFKAEQKLLSIESAKLEVERKLKAAEEANIISENKRQEFEHAKEIVKQKLQETVEAKIITEKKKNEIEIEKLTIEQILQAAKDANFKADNANKELAQINTLLLLEKDICSKLLHDMLPKKVAYDLQAGKQVPPEIYDQVTIFFSDIIGFTEISSSVPAIDVIKLLNHVYCVMDYCASLFSVYKVETIGDSYMVVGGLNPISLDNSHSLEVAKFSLLVQEAIKLIGNPLQNLSGFQSIKMRIGLHSGSVAAGVVGKLMPRYCLFGDTVNTASRMESSGESGQIHCSEAVYQHLEKTRQFSFEKREPILVKGKGIMQTYWLKEPTLSNKEYYDLGMIKNIQLVRKNCSESLFTEFVYPNFFDRTSMVAARKNLLDQQRRRHDSAVSYEHFFKISPGSPCQEM